VRYIPSLRAILVRSDLGIRLHIWPGGAENSTSRDDGRQKEQLEAFKIELAAEEVEAIAAAGRGKFYRHFQHGVWDGAKP
jgi:diketogulonate reductase-like aldo/keto reductase